MEQIEVQRLTKQRIRVRLVTLGAQLYKVVQAENELKKNDLENCISRCNTTLNDIAGLLGGIGIGLGEEGVITAIRDSLNHISNNNDYKNTNKEQNIYANPRLKEVIVQNIRKAYSSYEKMKELIS